MRRHAQAVVFDCDGVLVDSEELALEVELALLDDCGLTFERGEFIRRFMGTSDVSFRDALDAESQGRLGRPLRPDFLEVAHGARQAACRARLTEVAGAAEAVRALSGAKGVASSSHTTFLREKLEQVGLAKLFDPHIYSADLVERPKPAPDIFLYAAARLGSSPERTLVIEDSVNGVVAARAAGMTAWGFTGGSHCDETIGASLLAAGADRIVCSWAEAAELFRTTGSSW